MGDTAADGARTQTPLGGRREEGVRTVIDVMRSDPELRVRAIRLDPGDPGGLDEHEIARLAGESAPIDGFGVGTSMGVSDDAPALDIACKLTEYAGRGRLKLSAGKRTLPGRKQIFRASSDARVTGDTIARADESLPGRALLHRVMEGGRRVNEALPELADIRERAAREVRCLPAALRALRPAGAPLPRADQ